MQEKIKELLLESGLFELPPNSEDSLIDYGLDSLTIVLLIAKVEKEFSIRFDSTHFTTEHFSTIKSITEYIEKIQIDK